jgi:hypothetical protein
MAGSLPNARVQPLPPSRLEAGEAQQISSATAFWWAPHICQTGGGDSTQVVSPTMFAH